MQCTYNVTLWHVCFKYCRTGKARMCSPCILELWHCQQHKHIYYCSTMP